MGFGGDGGAGASAGGHAPASTISNQYDSDIQRAIQVRVSLLEFFVLFEFALLSFCWRSLYVLQLSNSVRSSSQ
jgi:hypothetical protein